MKVIILKAIVSDKDVETVVKSAKKQLPTWQVEVRNVRGR